MSTPGAPGLYRASYRYVRLALVTLLLAILVAAGWEWLTTVRQGAGCVQTSLSAYWYTPARPVFSGAMVAIAVCLIALRTPDDREDALLNVAGVGALLVALIPTPGGPAAAACASIAPADGAVVRDTVLNSMVTVLAVGFVTLLVVGIAQWRDAGTSAGFWSLVGAWLLAAAWLVLFAARTTRSCAAADTAGAATTRCLTPFLTAGHLTGALLLFGCIAAVVAINHRRTVAGRMPTASVPAGIFIGMVGGGALEALARLVFPGWSHFLLVLELTELLLFAAFWLWQTGETGQRAAQLLPDQPAVKR